MRDYTDKVVVVTGAGSGIGRALALEMARRGAQLALADIDHDALQATTTSCTDLGARALCWTVDVAQRDAVYDFAAQVVDRFQQIDVVVNNAGVAVHGRIAETTDADFEWIMDINFWGMVHGSRAFLPHLVASGDGQLANVSSVFGLIVRCVKDVRQSGSFFSVRQQREAAGFWL